MQAKIVEIDDDGLIRISPASRAALHHPPIDASRQKMGMNVVGVAEKSPKVFDHFTISCNYKQAKSSPNSNHWQHVSSHHEFPPQLTSRTPYPNWYSWANDTSSILASSSQSRWLLIQSQRDGLGGGKQDDTGRDDDDTEITTN